MADEKYNSHANDILTQVHGMLQDIHPVIIGTIPQMNALMSSIATAQNTMSVAASSMASTNAKAEARYEKMEKRLQDVNDRAAGKGQVPYLTHYITVGIIALIAILTVLYVNKQAFDASLTSVKIAPATVK